MKDKFLGMFEVDQNVIHLSMTDTHLFTNGVCNEGNYHIEEFVIDDCFSLDENIDNFMEDLYHE